MRHDEETEMSDRFTAGDIVVCVNAQPNPAYQPDASKLRRLKECSIYRVAAFLPPPGRPGLQLVGVDHSPGDGWQAERFRKIEPADPEFIMSIADREVENA
jgi:hypothetical protein